MAIAEVIVHKQLGGHTWSNTHAIQVGASPTIAPTDQDLITAGAGGTFTPATTSGSPADILHAIVAAERAVHFPLVTITGVLVTDGKRNSGPTPSTVYASLSMSLPGVAGGAAVTADTLEVGSIAMMVHRNPVGFSHKPGRIFFRGALAAAWIGVGGPRMVQWAGGNPPNAAVGQNLSAATAFLVPYFSGGVNAATAQYVIPIYVTPKQFLANPTGPKTGSLVNVIPCSGWALVGPVARQTNRGRKRK